MDSTSGAPDPAPVPRPALTVARPAAGIPAAREHAVDLPPRTEASRLARQALRSALDAWQLRDPDVHDAACLVVAELVGNAVRYGGPRVHLEIELHDDVLHLAVADGSPALPAVKDAGPAEEGGRGMALVAAVTDDWGVEPCPPGKRVWAHLRLDDRTA